jgi:hypothetical protein
MSNDKKPKPGKPLPEPVPQSGGTTKPTKPGGGG